MKYLLLLLVLSGCAMERRVGDYVTEAAMVSAQRKFELELHKRDITITELAAVADVNSDGAVNGTEIAETVKRGVMDIVAIKLEAKEQSTRVEYAAASAELRKELTATLEGESSGWEVVKEKVNNWFLALLGMVAAYLGKQIFSAKADGKRDTRIALMEKASGIDINQNGVIGNGDG